MTIINAFANCELQYTMALSDRHKAAQFVEQILKVKSYHAIVELFIIGGVIVWIM